jgi:hypothetical protein
VPLGKLKTERLVPVDSFVCRLVDRLRLLRFQDPRPADGFLLARPSGRDALIRKLRNFCSDPGDPDRGKEVVAAGEFSQTVLDGVRGLPGQAGGVL